MALKNVAGERKRFHDVAYAARGVPPPSDDIRVRIALEMIGSGHRILDIGCYDGSIAARIASQGNEVVGIDLSGPAVDLARKRGVNVLEWDAERPFPMAAGAFDVVFAGEVIEHVYNVDAFLAETRRVLVPGGTLVLTTPNLASLGRRLLLLAGRDPLTNVAPFEGAGHLRYFVRNTLRTFLERHGFPVIALRSDVVHLSPSGRWYSRRLAALWPTLGRTLIVKAVRADDADRA